MSIQTNKVYENGTFRTFLTVNKSPKTWSVWVGEDYGLNEKVQTFTNRFDAVCHAELIINEHKLLARREAIKS